MLSVLLGCKEQTERDFWTNQIDSKASKQTDKKNQTYNCCESLIWTFHVTPIATKEDKIVYLKISNNSFL